MGNVKHTAIALVISILLIIGIGFWIEGRHTPIDTSLSTINEIEAPLSPEELAVNNPAITNTMNRNAIFTTNKGVIKLELFEDKMPITTGNFVKLAEQGFYNGTKFHRVIDGFMIQGGDPNSKGDNTASYGTGGPEYTIQDEFVADPLLTNVRGTIAMANTGQPNSGGSQFFINTADNVGLDFDKEPAASRHPVFGRVIDGMDVVSAISAVETGPRDLPLEPVIIESISIE
jgi:cyclophilin family peptidyl-prolyl cis-trans isomerase